MTRLENFPTWTCVVAVAIEAKDGRWLMHRRPDHKHHGGLWEFPGGKVESGETPAKALIREIVEELGIVLEEAALNPVSFAEQVPGTSDSQIVILLYTCRDWTGEPEALEGGAIGWFTPEEIGELSRPPLDIALSTALFKFCAS